MVINLGLMVVVPRLVIRSFPHPPALTRIDELLIHSIFYALITTRGVVMIGQSTLVVFGLMLASFRLREQHWLGAGILLGFALSKYSLAFPLLLFLLLESKRRNILVIATAALVQLAGILIVAWISGDTPLAIVQDYTQIMGNFAGMQHGLQLAILFPPGSSWAAISYLALSLIVVGLLTLWMWRRRRLGVSSLPLANFNLLVTLVLYTFLVFYQGGYDSLVVFLAVPLCLSAIRHPSRWHISARQAYVVTGALVVYVGVMCMPYRTLNAALRLAISLPSLTLLFDQGYVVTMLLLLGVSLWLLIGLGGGNRSVDRTVAS
jgi:hypothetical protein